jgi:hypothetical protein
MLHLRKPRTLAFALAAVIAALLLPGTALAAAPTVATGPVTNITSTQATFNGSVNPEGSATTFHWDYATATEFRDLGYVHSTPDVLLGVQGVPFLVGDYTPGTTVSGLSPKTTYHVRFVASNSDGTSYGGDVTFTTLRK